MSSLTDIELPHMGFPLALKDYVARGWDLVMVMNSPSHPHPRPRRQQQKERKEKKWLRVRLLSR